MEHVVKALQKPVMLKVLLCLLLLFDHHRLALATSGGVMGGSDFSSFSDRHSSASDSSFSSKGDSAHNTYSSRRDSQYDSYSSRRDSPDTSYSSTRESSYSSNTPTPPIGSADIFLFICFLAIFLMCCYLYHRRGDHGEDTSFKTSVFKLQVGLLGTARSLQKDLNEMLSQLILYIRWLQAYIESNNCILLQHPDYYTSGYSCFESLGTSNLRQVENGSSVKEAEKQFQKLSFDERSKFDEETLVNLNNVIKQSATSQKFNEYTAVDMGSKFDEEPLFNVENVRKRNATSQMFQGVSCNEYIVVTIIVAAYGLHKLPPVKSNAELKEALQTLASVPSSKIMAAVVLWTPQKKDDTFSVQELLKTSSDINEVLWRSIQKVVKALQKPVITGVILVLLLLYDHHYSRLALAAPGGSMVWSFHISDSSSSSSDDEDSQSYRTRNKTPKSEAEAKA
ncbi:myelin-associated oligodendrocyte basic protein [Tanacetum coccineum]